MGKSEDLSLSEEIRQIPRAWKIAIVVFLIVRILASATALIAYTTVPPNPIVRADNYAKPSYSCNFEILLGVWERSDALWYINIAKNGYRPGSKSAVFMPLYPMTIRAVRWITRLPWLACALLVSNACLILALFALYRLAVMETDRDTARRAVWYQALFPGSLFLLAPYTESLYLALATLAFLAARNRKWSLAGLAGAALGVTRNMGVLIIVPLAVEFYLQRKQESPPSLLRGGWLLMIPTGFISYLFSCYLRTGNFLEFIQQQSGWQRQFMMPWTTVAEGIKQAYQFAGSPSGGIYVMEAAAAVGMIGLAVYSFKKISLPLSLFAWLHLLPPLFAPFPGRMLLSFVRFSAVIFPLFITLAATVRNRHLDNLVKTLFAGLYGLSVALYVASQNMF